MLYRVLLDTTLDVEANSPDEAARLAIAGDTPITLKVIELKPQRSLSQGAETLVEILLKEG
jgi:hypothetical protein